MKKVIIFPFLHSEKLLTDILYLHRADELDKIEILGIVPSGYYNSIKECCKKTHITCIWQLIYYKRICLLMTYVFVRKAMEQKHVMLLARKSKRQ